MKIARMLAALAAAACLCGALAESEYPVDLPREEVRQMELRLSELGYLVPDADDEFDADTRLAVESFQQANGLEVTGLPDEATLQRLHSSDALSRQDYLHRFSNAYAHMTPLQKGSANNDVLALQRRLKEFGYFSGETDGVFGDATQMAVESFQMANGLKVTGIADGSTLMRLMADSPITWPGFLSEMSASPGDSGLNVYVLQTKLRQLGYFDGACTGSYGELTQKAVTRFQAENGLEQTGAADAATWAALYSGAALSPQRDDVMRLGSEGFDVRDVQQRLQELGYYEHTATGIFDYTTETAVRLFQIASGSASTGEVDTAAMDRMMRDSAPSLKDERTRQNLRTQLDASSDSAQGAVAGIANHLLGTAFGKVDDGLYPGFSFVQYVCTAAGMPVAQPEDLIRIANQQVTDLSTVEAGDIVIFQNTEGDSVTLQMTVGAGEGKVYRTTEKGGWVVLSFIDQLPGASIYRWNGRSAFGE